MRRMKAETARHWCGVQPGGTQMQSSEKQEVGRGLGHPLVETGRIATQHNGSGLECTRALRGRSLFSFQARCLSATWNWRSRGVVFIAAQLLRLGALLSGNLSANPACGPEWLG